MYEDQVFLSKIYLNENIFISSAYNNRYRQRPDSLIGKSFDNGNYYNVRKRFLVWLKKYISDNNIAYRDVQEKLENALSFEPLVSVIICFFNEKFFLQEAIESVLKQSYKCWELLLVDDGSTDGSSGIALEYAYKYPGKIYYHEHNDHTNKGLSASRNHGIKNSEGEFIAFLDADDAWLENKLITQVSIFQRNAEVGMVAESSLYWNEWQQGIRLDKEILIGADAEIIYEPYDLMLSLYPLGKGAAPVPSGIMVKKIAIERSGMFEESFAKEYALYEDQAFLSKMYLNEKIYISSACNNLYRQRPGSIVTWVKESGKYHIVREFFFRWLKDYLNSNKITNSDLTKRLTEALYRYNHPKLFYVTHDIPRNVWKGFKKLIPGEIKDFMKWKILKLEKGG